MRRFRVIGYDRAGKVLFSLAVEAFCEDDAKLVAMRELRQSPTGTGQANRAEKLEARPERRKR